MKQSIVIVSIVAIITLMIFLSTGKTERKILNAFAEQDRGVPEWIKVDWTNESSSGTSHQITYGLGGRTCHSIVIFNNEAHMEEYARKCN